MPEPNHTNSSRKKENEEVRKEEDASFSEDGKVSLFFTSFRPFKERMKKEKRFLIPFWLFFT